MLELKEFVFSIDPDSSPGPDGLSGHFYQSTWNIIVANLHRAVSAFFSVKLSLRALTTGWLLSSLESSPKIKVVLLKAWLFPLFEGIKTRYEKISGQLINKNKSSFSLKSKVSLSVVNKMKRYTGMRFQKFPIRYLGCPLITGKKKLAYYSDIVNKVTSKVRGWHTKFVSTGGRATLIRHVLMAIPTHILSSINPPKCTLELIEKIIARFFFP
ncbi:hypothetical protein KY290_013956 [Solanum tuberosum]|uniref:RNA-directed DNA polymerase (Reverse transcriptase) n=1 Tax=Solanum tuberosum TaxID=4113 RepID=A0ABQ7VNA4_SOLTU|nr:hypothetical protein KY290_013956 [Solanum tuberosum]